MTEGRRRLLEALGRQGADGDKLAELLGTDYLAELAGAITDGDAHVNETYARDETGIDPEPPLRTFHLTEQGARKVSIDPNEVIGL